MKIISIDVGIKNLAICILNTDNRCNNSNKFSIYIEKWDIIDLFECRLDIEFLESESPNQETYSETLYLLRPTWSESDERSILLQEKKDALLNQRTFESF